MSELSKIKVNDIAYNLKDSEARELIANKQDKVVYITYTTSNDGETFTCNKTYNEILTLANSSNSLVMGRIITASGNSISEAIQLGSARIHADVIEWPFLVIDESRDSVTMVEISHKDDNSIVMNIINNSMPNIIYTVTSETTSELVAQGHSTHITCNYNFSDIAQLMASQIKFYPILNDGNNFMQLTINYANINGIRLDAITATTGTDIRVISIDHNSDSLSIREYNAPALKTAISLPEQFEDNEELWMVEEPILYYGNEIMPFNFIKCSSLPENNITPITTDNESFTMYYISRNNIQGYVPTEIASQYSLEAGWYTLQQLLTLYSQIIDSNAEYVGVVSDYSELMAENTGEPHDNYGLVIYHNFYIYEDGNRYLYLGGPAIQPGEGKNSIIINNQRDTADGDYSFVHGGKNGAHGKYSHAEGYMTGTSVTGEAAHSEGSETGATGYASHAEGGYGSQASGSYSHAEGEMTIASGTGSHSEGYNTSAAGVNSHAEGVGTIANCFGQHTSGRYNIAETAPAAEDEWGTYAEIVGNGTDENNRSNARTLDWNGNETITGKMTIGIQGNNNLDVATVGYVNTQIGTLHNYDISYDSTTSTLIINSL